MITRDPASAPKVGDVIQQSGGTLLRVTSIDGTQISWQRKHYGKWVYDNTWTLAAWEHIVASGAELIEQTSAR